MAINYLLIAAIRQTCVVDDGSMLFTRQLLNMYLALFSVFLSNGKKHMAEEHRCYVCSRQVGSKISFPKFLFFGSSFFPWQNCKCLKRPLKRVSFFRLLLTIFRKQFWMLETAVEWGLVSSKISVFYDRMRCVSLGQSKTAQ